MSLLSDLRKHNPWIRGDADSPAPVWSTAAALLCTQRHKVKAPQVYSPRQSAIAVRRRLGVFTRFKKAIDRMFARPLGRRMMKSSTKNYTSMI